jgi:hypothetical protein
MNVSCLLFLYVDCFDCLLSRKGHRGARRPEALVPPQRERRAGDHPGGVQGRLRAHTSPLVLCYIIISPDAVFVCCSLPRRGCVPCVACLLYKSLLLYTFIQGPAGSLDLSHNSAPHFLVAVRLGRCVCFRCCFRKIAARFISR